jgi:hypothetical protein
MEQFIITIYQPTESVAKVATLLGWDGEGSAKEYVSAILAPKVQEAIANIILEPARMSLQNTKATAFAQIEQEQAALNEMIPQIIQGISIS